MKKTFQSVVLLVIVCFIGIFLPMAKAGATDSSHDESKLIKAIWTLKEDEALKIIAKKTDDLNFRTRSTGLTPLFAAIQTKNIKVVRALLDAGANPNQIDRNGCLAIHHTKSEEVKNLLKSKGSWSWLCTEVVDPEMPDANYFAVNGCLKPNPAEKVLARKINDIGLDLYRGQETEFAIGAWKAAAHLDCKYLLPRTNLAASNAKSENYDVAIRYLDEAFNLDSTQVVNKLKTDVDYNGLIKSTKFKFTQAWRSLTAGTDARPIVSSKLPIKVSNGDEIDVKVEREKTESEEYPYNYFLISKKRGRFFLFNNCRGHAYHHCSDLEKNVSYDPDSNHLILSLICSCAGEYCAGNETFKTKVSVDLKSMKAVDDEFSKIDPGCPVK